MWPLPYNQCLRGILLHDLRRAAFTSCGKRDRVGEVLRTAASRTASEARGHRVLGEAPRGQERRWKSPDGKGGSAADRLAARQGAASAPSSTVAPALGLSRFHTHQRRSRDLYPPVKSWSGNLNRRGTVKDAVRIGNLGTLTEAPVGWDGI